MAEYLVGYQSSDELDQIERFGRDKSLPSTARTVLPILREVVLADAPGQLAAELREAIPSLRFVSESRSAPFNVSFTPVSLQETIPDNTLPWSLQRIGLPSAKTGKNVRVAVLDTGLDMSHPDFITRPNLHFMDARSRTDASGHGTFVAGLIGGPMIPHQGPRYGVAPDVSLFVANVTDSGGHATSEARLSVGIEWALDNNCQVINISWDLPFDPSSPFSPLETKGEEALSRNCIVIAAAGNTSSRPSYFAPVSAPARAKSILAVGSIGVGNQVCRFSPRSDASPGGEVDFVAPGEAVRSSFKRQIFPPEERWYEFLSFTSFSTALVSGIAALHLEAGVAPADLKKALDDGTFRVKGLPADVGSGVPQVP